MARKTLSRRRTKIASPSRPTIKDIARRCDVHSSTVSRALGPATHHLVAEDLVRRIRAAAAALGYRPNHAAAGLRTGRSGLIGVLAPDIADPGFSPILAGLAGTLNAAGYAMIVVDVGPRGSQQQLVNQLVARGVDGLLFTGVTLRDPVIRHCIDAAIPVLAGRADAGRRLSSVVTDHESGIRLAVEHLVSLGHQRIGHVAGPPDAATDTLRRETMIENARANTRMAGRSAALRLLERKAPPTAIVASYDLLALGTYDALAVRGLTCPKEVLVVCRHDMPYVDKLSPPLTAVSIARRDMGEQAARLLLDRIATPGLRCKHIVLGPTLILRASTAAPGAGTANDLML